MESDNSMKQVLGGRKKILETQLSAIAVQIVERLKIKSKNLDELLAEELRIGNRLLPIQEQGGIRRNDMMGLENLLLAKQFEIGSERRRQDVECWRDLVGVMRDFLRTWEDLTGLEAKERFLGHLKPPDTQKRSSSNGSTNHYENLTGTTNYKP